MINSKNISDLVNHKMASLPKNLYMTQQSPVTQQETSYDFKFDPVNFRQKIPCMGERNFLVNQAILVNSSQQNARNAAQLRKKRMQRQTRAKTGTRLPLLPLA